MSFEDAHEFVQKMRDDTKFRNSVGTIGDSNELWQHLKTNGFDFDACDLVKAMAACMADLESMA